ncbi:indolepyruvate oxidoreductase subunit B [Chromatiales bacterium (ex Bugula neritina AB1)]|nr:indolepyruvate oxidoreductase subunit B [Chromatiales bacterium (ex Bugula neritina AB1)]
MPNASHTSTDTSAAILKIAIHAVGGQGGGVLANWISDLATSGGYAVQMTSVAGVAQRTGATIYYIEMAQQTDRAPVFALTPSPGDVDILIAAELMEAGRAVVRGFVTPDRTTLIASSHRILAVDEKTQPGDGRADSPLVYKKVKQASHKVVCFDMEAIASRAGSMISASLFGALARSGDLPFATELFEQVIRNSGRGVDASIDAFRGALNYDEGVTLVRFDNPPGLDGGSAKSLVQPVGPARLLDQWQRLTAQIKTMPEPVHHVVTVALQKVVDYQDIAYGQQYLENLQQFVDLETGEDNYELLKTAAKYLANAMCYDDIVRVADLKTRASRNRRLRREQEAGADQIVHVTEYFHPGAQEVCGTLPAGIGRRIEGSPRMYKLLDKLVNKGRRLRTDSASGFLALWIASSLKPIRRKLLRHQVEEKHVQKLIHVSLAAAERSVPLAIEILKCQRLVKGYSDTHARGHSKYQMIIDSLDTIEQQANAVACLSHLRETAVKDESGELLEVEIKALAER